MNQVCVIFAGGRISAESIEIPENAYLICADRGVLTAEKLGLKPDYIVGDFDSLGYVPQYEGTETHPCQKDDTDTMLAVKHVCEKGFSDVLIYGALGGRLDHTIANLQALRYLAERGITGVLLEENNRVTMQNGGTKCCYSKREGWYFSLLSFSEECTGVCVSGTEYPLHNAVLTHRFPLGVSNHIQETYAEVSLRKGYLLVIESRDF